MSVWNFYKKAMSTSLKMGKSTSNHVASRVLNWQNATPRSVLNSGYYLNDDKIGDNLSGLKDYSSVCLPTDLEANDLQILGNGTMRLGNMFHPRQSREKYPFSIYDDSDETSVYRHTLLVGPPGTGKTHGIIIPALHSLLENNYRVVVNDIKGNMLSGLRKYKQEIQVQSRIPAFIWNPFTSDRNQTRRWNPLNEIVNIHDDTTINAIVDAIIGSSSSQGQQNTHFVERDQRWLSNLIKLVKKENQFASLSDIYDLINNQPQLEAKILYQNAPKIQGLNDLADAENSHYVAGLANKLAIFSRLSVKYATSASDFTIDYIIKNPGLLILHSPRAEGDEAFKTASLIFSVMRAKIYENGELPVQNRWLIDEAGQIAPRLNMDQDLDVIRSYNVGIFLAVQRLNQLGEHSYINYAANCLNKIILNSVDERTAEFFSTTLGTKQVKKMTKTIDFRNKPQWQQSNERVPVLEKSQIMYHPSDFGSYSGFFLHPQLAEGRPILLDFTR